MHTDDRYRYCQSIPVEWLQHPHERDRASLLEFARGTIYSLAKKDDGTFAAVHASRIQRSFKRIGAPGLCRIGLRLLELLREAQPLFGGYWLPTPFRIIEIEHEFVFIGAVPAAHGFLCDFQNEGLSRLLSRESADRFPRQSLEGWMGQTPQSQSDLIATFAAKHTRIAERTSNLSKVEYLSVVPTRARRYRNFEWGDRAIDALPSEQIAICRQTHSGRIRYFSASLSRGRIVSEAPIDMEMARLLFAIASHVGDPVKAVSRAAPRGVEITLNERLPIAEFRLSLLLSRKTNRAGRVSTFTLPPKLAPAFSTRLAALGCALETTK